MDRGRRQFRLADVAGLIVLGVLAACFGAVVVLALRASAAAAAGVFVVVGLGLLAGVATSAVKFVHGAGIGLGSDRAVHRPRSPGSQSATQLQSQKQVDVSLEAIVRVGADSRGRQCPRCGGFETFVHGPNALIDCTACGHSFAWRPNEPWPDVVVRPVLIGAESRATGESR